MNSPNGNILCTEDHADTRDLIAHLLTREGFQVTCAESGEHALRLAKSQVFNLYLVDNCMLDFSGVVLTKRLREFDTKTPILFYSGAVLELDQENARLAGAQGYLVKPAENEVLVSEVVRLIAESKIARPASN